MILEALIGMPLIVALFFLGRYVFTLVTVRVFHEEEGVEPWGFKALMGVLVLLLVGFATVLLFILGSALGAAILKVLQ